VIACPRFRPTPSSPRGSKNLSNRALANGRSMLGGLFDADDTRFTRARLSTLGVAMNELDADTLAVTGLAGRPPPSRLPTHAPRRHYRTAGTIARLLGAVLTASPSTRCSTAFHACASIRCRSSSTRSCIRDVGLVATGWGRAAGSRTPDLEATFDYVRFAAPERGLLAGVRRAGGWSADTYRSRETDARAGLIALPGQRPRPG
jgi:hypothetical protein